MPLPTPATEARFYALIPCGGTGTRAGTALPKQYHTVAGKPMVLHTLAAFAQVPRIVATWVVVAPGDEWWSRNSNATKNIALCAGNTRAITVLNGLNQLKSTGAQAQDWVLVHDAARCLITPSQIEAVIDACARDAVGGLMALPLADTLKSGAQGRVVATVARAGKWLAQTPQMFRIGPLIAALEQAGERVTDEASAIELQGLQPLLVRGSAQNFKVTYPEDFDFAEVVLRSRQ